MKIYETSPHSPELTIILELTEKDLDILERIIPPPFGEFKHYPETENVTREYAEKLVKELKSKVNDTFRTQEGFLFKFCNIFKVSCEILDPLEMQTITDIKWLDAMALYEKIFVESNRGGHRDVNLDGIKQIEF